MVYYSFWGQQFQSINDLIWDSRERSLESLIRGSKLALNSYKSFKTALLVRRYVSIFLCHTKNVDTSGKTVFSMHSFFLPMTPHLTNSSSCLCATLCRLMPTFQTLNSNANNSHKKITFRFNKSIAWLCPPSAQLSVVAESQSGYEAHL